MLKILSKAIGFVPGVLAFSLINTVCAAPKVIEATTANQTNSSLEKINQYTQLLYTELPLTSVDQISDIPLVDWAFPPLELKRDRYNCLPQFTDNLNEVQAARGSSPGETQGEDAVSEVTSDTSDVRAVSGGFLQSSYAPPGVYEPRSGGAVSAVARQTLYAPFARRRITLHREAQISIREGFAFGWATCIIPLKELTKSKQALPPVGGVPSTANDAADSVPRNQFAALKPSEPIFPAELASVQKRLEDLKVELEPLEANQISTRPRVSFSENNPSFRSRMSLSYRTSFSEGDRLRIGWRPEESPSFFNPTDTDLSRLEFEQNNNDNSNKLEFNSVEYRFDLTPQARVYIQALGGGIDDFAEELNSALGDTISRFGGGNPIIRQGGEKGIGLVYDLSEDVRLSVAHTIEDIYDGKTSIGSAASGTIINLTFTPGEVVGLGLTYVRSFNSLDTDTGSERANEPFDGDTDSLVGDSYGMELSFRISPDVTIGGWVGLTQAVAKDLANDPKADIFNYAITLTWENIGHEDNVAGIVIGQPPKVIGNDYEVDGQNNVDTDTSLHLEGFFTFQATDNLSITPGILVITNPEHDQSNDTTYIGTIEINFDF